MTLRRPSTRLGAAWKPSMSLAIRSYRPTAIGINVLALGARLPTMH